MPLSNKRVLIVEDENIVAMDLADAVTASGAKAIGPVGTVDAALEMIDTTDLDGVILDINLRGQMAFSVADVLATRHIPFIFETGYMSDRDIPVRYAEVPCVQKPFKRGAVCAALEGTMRPQRIA